MNKPEFVYTTYIRTTPAKVWEAITTPEFTRQYWGGNINVSNWKKGSKWEHVEAESGELRVKGEVVESAPPERLVLTWVDPSNAADQSRVTFEIEAIEDMVCLKVVHDRFAAATDMPVKIAWGWPRVLASLKSMLETGIPLNIWGGSKGNCGCAGATAEAAAAVA
jgi:uncharacterized protein YndB with AHSA1/START domain